MGNGGGGLMAAIRGANSSALNHIAAPAAPSARGSTAPMAVPPPASPSPFGSGGGGGGGGVSLLDEIKKGKALKAAEKVEEKLGGGGGGVSLLDEIKKGRALKKAEPLAPKPKDTRSTLMDAIKSKGGGLKHVDRAAIEAQKPKAEAGGGGGASNIASILARRIAIAADSESESDDSDDDWDD